MRHSLPQKGILPEKTHPLLLFALLTLVVNFIFVPLSAAGGKAIAFFTVGGLVLLCLVEIGIGIADRLTERELAALLLLGGFLLRVGYICYTSVTTRQHDVWYFGGDRGHAAYIEYYYEQLRIPDFDPRTRWQFYHPPLHHALAALWMRLQVALGREYKVACESIQVLTLYYATASTVLGYKILRFLKLHGAALLIPTAFLSFFPTFILLSGSINNDALSVALAFAAVYTALRWYEKPTFGWILLCAVCMGGSMMAKLSGCVVAPAIAILFLYRLFTGGKKWKIYILQFLCFGIVCVPLGLWWSVLNLVRWGMPLGYVPVLGSGDSGQYVGNYPLWQRLFGFFGEEQSNVFMAWEESSGASYHEYNIFLGLLKTAVFGEFTLVPMEELSAGSKQALVQYTGCIVLFFSHLVLTLTALIGAVVLCIKKVFPKKDSMLGLFFLAVAGFTLVMYFGTCMGAPHTCTMNFRYTVPLCLCVAAALGVLLQRLAGEKTAAARAMRTGLLCVTAIFCLSTALVYILLG